MSVLCEATTTSEKTGEKKGFSFSISNILESKVEEESEDGLHSEDDDEDDEEEEEEIKDEPAGFQALSGAGAQYLSSLSDLHFGNRHPLGAQEEGSPGVIKVPPHHPGQPLSLDYPAPWLYRPFTVLPGYLPLPSPLLINRFPGITGPCELKIL
ncbi:uncharacterized protein LOC111706386 [Eurytemora carolleeae]|uniref:uncharacterized protein LOC111706386 n=1 Tax=Eurytemora carolleeae TaxID=1294199 RepID=UPI000C780662|nr:uncharacterized protein LOC111706386 [Eurytemora carolleeae]|eukprot:XP_023335016.1 uncharacterized protein LOC111706386 [Eurytemora affinis]